MKAPRAGDGCLYLGPLASSALAKQVAEAIESAVPIRRCTAKPGRVPRDGACTPAQLGVSTCPCAGAVSEDDYRALVDTVVRGLTVEPDLLLMPLDRKMRSLAAAGRFEEAASVRDRASALAKAIARQRRLDGLRRAGRLVVDVAGAGQSVLEHGVLVRGDDSLDLFTTVAEAGAPGPLPKALADELATVAAWLDQRAALVRLVSCDGELASPLPRLPSFQPKPATTTNPAAA